MSKTIDAANNTVGSPPGDSPFVKPPLRKLTESTSNAAEETRLLRQVSEKLYVVVNDLKLLVANSNMSQAKLVESQSKLVEAIALNTEAILKHSETTIKSAEVIENHRVTSDKMIEAIKKL